jgi:hypothetical protein
MNSYEEGVLEERKVVRPALEVTDEDPVRRRRVNYTAME